jgi:DNA invertase Pin-like site-specific DNA recombinase
MKDQAIRRSLRCAIYTRVSTEQGLEQDFNSLDAQREACEAYIKSQAHEGWRLVRIVTTTAASPAGRWKGQRSRSCSLTCRRDGST